MDTEAAARGTTVYLVDKRVDMLPSLLGTNLCSLRPFVERLAFSAIWVCSLPLAPNLPQLTGENIHPGIDTRCRDRERAVHEVCDFFKIRFHV